MSLLPKFNTVSSVEPNKAHVFTIDIYKITGNFPREERYGLINQIRRASV
ncbi:MAG: four helix bundle protein [Xenococcaceae cyanobacterium MO_207.B15]|nr:four helix bundle protein [Xenococcaceae cyanobacterium MO_207.B15]